MQSQTSRQQESAVEMEKYFEEMARKMDDPRHLFLSFGDRLFTSTMSTSTATAMTDPISLLDIICEEYIPRQYSHVTSCTIQIQVMDDSEYFDQILGAWHQLAVALQGLSELRSLTFRYDFNEQHALNNTHQSYLSQECRIVVLRLVRQITILNDKIRIHNERPYANALEGHENLEQVTIWFDKSLDRSLALQSALLSLPRLQKISCSNFFFFRPAIFRSLVTKPTLQTLCYSADILPLPERWEILFQALGNGTSSIVNLELEHGSLTMPNYFTWLLCAGLSSNRTLRTIKLHFKCYFNENMGQFGLQLGLILGNHPTLISLDVSLDFAPRSFRADEDEMAMQQEWSYLLAGLSASRTLRKFTMACDGCQWTNEMMQGLKRFLRHVALTEFNLHGSVSDVCIRGLAETLLDNKSYLRTLRINPDVAPSVTKIGAFGRQFGKSLGRKATLQELFLQAPPTMFRSQQDTLEWTNLLTGLATTQTLRKLTLLEFHWNGEACTALQFILRQGLTELRIEGAESYPDWLRLLRCLTIAGQNSLCKLSLSLPSFQSAIPLLADQSLDELQAAGKEQEVGCNIMQEVGHVVRVFHKTLEDLAVGCMVKCPFQCPFSSLVGLVQMLGQHDSFICSLRLDLTFLYDASAWDLINALRCNYKLTTFFTACIVGAAQTPFLQRHHRALIEGLLQMNAAGRRYMLTDPFNKECGVTVLLAVAQNLDCLFMHIVENPNLCHIDCRQ